MFAKISLKKLMFLSLGLLIIGALTNCGGSGGGGSAAPAAKKPVETAPDPEKEDPDNGKGPGIEYPGSCTADQFFIDGECVNNTVFNSPAVIVETSDCKGDLVLEVTINEQKECFNADEQAIDFVLTSTAEGSERSWPNTDVTVDLAVNDATLAVKNCYVKEVVQGKSSSFKADFSNQLSCDVLAKSKANDNQRTYKINIVHGISEADDFRSDFFASAAARFVLTKDIILTADTTSFAPSFYGQLDGLDHTISELSIEADTGTDRVGLISKIDLSVEDSTVEIKNLTLGITKLTGKTYVGGLIGQVWSAYGAKAVQINDVTVEFTDPAKLECVRGCGGLVGSADSRVHFSDIVVKGEVSVAGSNFGGVVGGANAMELSGVKAHFNIKHPGGGEFIGLVAGVAYQNAILSKIDASGVITCEGLCNSVDSVGGVVGLIRDSQLSQVKSSLRLNISSNAQNVGGVVGKSFNSNLTAVYGKLTADVIGATNFGSILGNMEQGGSLEKAVGYLNVTANGLHNSGSLIGGASTGQMELKQVFTAGSMTADNISPAVGQMIGQIDAELTAENCYSGAFAGKTIPGVAVGEMTASASASFTKCYTRAGTFVPYDGDLSWVTFDNVYAPTAQTGGKGSTEVKPLPDPFEASILNDDDSTIWTNEYDGNEYTYPMLAYPDSMKDMKDGPVSEADWFKHQIENNPEVQVDSNTGS